MARRKQNSNPSPEPPEVTPEKGIQLLRTVIKKAKDLLASRPLSEDDYSSWELFTQNLLEKSFGRHSPNISSVMNVGKYGAFQMGAGAAYWEEHHAKSLQTQKRKLEGLVELLETEIQFESGQAAPIPHVVSGHKIFLVHGHDEKMLHETARFLEKLRQEVIVLREQPNKGRTIIEKFEDYSDVGFAIVLLTGDDRGGPLSLPFEDQEQRARQNVIFEFGYFIGKLGRNRVCGLHTQGVELPSDYSGVLYVKIDEGGGWRLELAKELKAAGLPVNMNLAL